MAQNRPQPHSGQAAKQGRLTAQPVQPGMEAAPTGLHQLDLDGPRDGLLYVPASYRADRPAPLVLTLHGAGGDARSSLAPLQLVANMTGLLLLAPDSRRQTWDIIMGGYGPDVTFIDRALEQIFSRYAVDPTHLAIGGFSDGASYALSLGLTNGDLFTHIIAFSPGFMAPARREGSPHIFVSHGTRDAVLPIEKCSRRLVPQLKREGYDVLYREFDGPHTVPIPIVREAWNWFTDRPDGAS